MLLSLFHEKINNIDKSMANLTKCGGKRPKLIKSEMKRGRQKQTPRKSRESPKTNLRNFIPKSWKIFKKWTNF
jgi:hypothetical protein